ncbi:DEAD-box ATP-dependent RNA helicase 53-like [Brachionus plicatilis]|uniref:DEAD-box ATP-dependent RNA helicase 53-like n=1 Tax=Brachionus plicatilis TaxID=10195 RepID=A0A3M7QMP0_BRAPC|nr:DEAD-box ATP-dependent RNA helicase 53-like [Brachionus plicatilis]
MTSKKQMLMFSATINKSVQGLIAKYMTNPVTVDLTEGQKQKLPANIEHLSVKTHNSLYDQIILHCLNQFKSERCIIFSNMKRDAIRLNFFLARNGFKTSDLHSDLSQRKREIILEKFRKGSLDIIVATDVAARGIDIPEVDLVIQAGAPANGIDFYIHRSGRTGRAGRVGRSVLIDDGTKPNFTRMINRLISFKALELPDWLAQKNNEHMSSRSEEDFHMKGKYTKRYGDWRQRENFGFN